MPSSVLWRSAHSQYQQPNLHPIRNHNNGLPSFSATTPAYRLLGSKILHILLQLIFPKALGGSAWLPTLLTWSGQNSSTACYSRIGCDTGNPRVYFFIPIPVPANTVPARVGVQCLSWVSTGHRGYSRVSTELSILIIYYTKLMYIHNKNAPLSCLE